uniref:Uncharacterized protein n=1 Tax=Romanomermis culicivorax TaxID=13658 RepID=A0A915JH80_ROMCU
LGDGFKGQSVGPVDDRKAGSTIRKRFSVEGKRMRVGGRRYKNVSSGRRRGFSINGDGVNSYGWVTITGNARETEGEYVNLLNRQRTQVQYANYNKTMQANAGTQAVKTRQDD